MARRNEIILKDGLKREDYIDSFEAAQILEVNKERLQRLTEAKYKDFPQQVKIAVNREKIFYKKAEIESWAINNDPNEVERKVLIEMAKELNPDVFIQRGSRKKEPRPIPSITMFDRRMFGIQD